VPAWQATSQAWFHFQTNPNMSLLCLAVLEHCLRLRA
jgi:hypothetical protein